MKDYKKSENSQVNEYLDEVASEIRRLFLEVRSVVLSAEPRLKESIKWRNCLVYSDKKNVIQTVTGKSHITLIFFEGSQLEDPNYVLEGEDNKKTRSFKISSPDFNKHALKDLVTQAVKFQ